MKKLLSILLLSIFLFGCTDEDSTKLTSDGKVILTKEEYNKLKYNTAKSEYPSNLKIGNNHTSRCNFTIEFGSDGHEYAHNITEGFNEYVCFHYVDCKKCKPFLKDSIK